MNRICGIRPISCEGRWSHPIKSKLFERQGKAITNFNHALPEPQSDLVILLAENGYPGYPPVDRDEVYQEIFEQAENFKKYRKGFSNG